MRGSGSNIANQQDKPLALMPYGAITCTFDGIIANDASTGLPRMTYEVIGQSAGGCDLFGVVVNDLETPEQQEAFERWQHLRSIMLTDPAQGRTLLDGWGDEVKLPIHRGEHPRQRGGGGGGHRRDHAGDPRSRHDAVRRERGRRRPPRPRDPDRDP